MIRAFHGKPCRQANLVSSSVVVCLHAELTLLGFMSLLLTVARNPISKLCMPAGWAGHMLPCPLRDGGNSSAVAAPAVYPSPQASGNVFGTRRLHQSVDSIAFPAPFPHAVHRILAEGASHTHRCNKVVPTSPKFGIMCFEIYQLAKVFIFFFILLESYSFFFTTVQYCGMPLVQN